MKEEARTGLNAEVDGSFRSGNDAALAMTFPSRDGPPRPGKPDVEPASPI